ncbi:MAG TPA: hypothetical protein VNG12_18375 [Acidimicrobiales bacterium]|nr:hypothetical protein [Acidimicrobiales bacterium]
MDFKRKLLVAGVAIMPVLGIGGLAYASTSSATGQTGNPAVTTTGPQSPDNTTTSDAPETPSSTGVAGTETDGPGGHQDPSGANVDHQFQGQE